MTSPGGLFSAALFVFGLVWMRQMVGRWRSDLDEWRTSKDDAQRTSIAIVWSVTASSRSRWRPSS